MTPKRPQAGFTLVEILVVLGIIVLVSSMVFSYMSKRDMRGTQVRLAAEQLVSVLRKARQLAMDHRSVYGVTFNISNSPGSSGAVLNNRSGGHWYRIIGPSTDSLMSAGPWDGIGNYNYPLRFDRGWGGSNDGPPRHPNDPGADIELPWWLSSIQSNFIGGKIVLPKGQVRFLALADQDNGNCMGQGCTFPPGFPRPWFGEFVQLPGDTKPRFYGWGGYDPQLTDFSQTSWFTGWTPHISPTTHSPISYTGFYYEGYDGPITGCVNPSDRLINNDPSNHCDKNTQPSYLLFKKGEPRPVVNGNWLDAVILFYPDGTAVYDDWMNMRHQYGKSGGQSSDYSYFNDTENHNLGQLGPGDMCNYIQDWDLSMVPVPYNNRYEASHYADRTGTWYITLAADALDDTVDFPSAQAALSAMNPIWRVGITKLGEIKYFEVKHQVPRGVVLDPTWVGTRYENSNASFSGYWNNLLTTPNGPCMPAEDFVTPDMLANRQWWIDP